MEAKQFLIKKFREYYRKTKIKLPNSFERREFAFVPFETFPEFIMQRHISFTSEEDFRGYVTLNVPAHVYYSSAYYQNPEKERMEEKHWLGADLIFDIDADHLPLTSNSMEKALEVAKKEVKKLLQVLKLDFGIKEAEVFFSGARGYHIHVCEEEFLKLDSAERREIVDYIMINSPIILQKKKIFDSNIAIRLSTYLRKKKKLEGKELLRELKNPTELIEKFRIHIDAPVTADVKRLIRMPGTLHGKTGLKVVRVEDLDSFDPLRDAVAFGEDRMKLRVLNRIKLKIGEEELDLFQGETVEIPEFAGIYLLCRGYATL
ncbi:MAG: DNA primase catalytic subunit PriS [Archaeoglobaceae archaeon]|nr:DNA primase catalytic subunit PriS [Archaeoglobaceae archaeon]MDW8128297.1 DNA primase catalytic subunit PriS [Archaeoglobaceae archaeon]